MLVFTNSFIETELAQPRSKLQQSVFVFGTTELHESKKQICHPISYEADVALRGCRLHSQHWDNKLSH